MTPSKSFADSSRQIYPKKMRIKMKDSTKYFVYGFPIFIVGMFCLFFSSYMCMTSPGNWLNFPTGLITVFFGIPGFILLLCSLVQKLDDE